MTSTTTNTISKVAAIVAAFGLVAMSFVAAIPAHAQTASTSTTMTTTTNPSQAASLQAQIASLQAQLAAAQGGSMMTSMTFSRNLHMGSKGADVTALQTFLIGKGFSIPAGATGYFGGQTKAALAAYQSAKGITPAVGYFGPLTMASVNSQGGANTTTTTTTTTTVAGCAAGAMFSSTTGQSCGTTTTTTGGSVVLQGAGGSVSNFQTIGASSITMGASGSQQVNGFSFTATGSDLNIGRIYYDVVNTNTASTNSGSVRPWVVFQTATLKDGSGNVVATVDATNQANWSQDGTATVSPFNQIYRLSFENINKVVKMNMNQQYYLTLSTQSAIATGNAGGIYAVSLAPQGLRAVDALGIQEYSGSAAQTPTLVTVNTSVTGSVTISTGSNNPQTTTVQANSTNTTQNVTVNTFTVQNTGGTNVTLYTLPVQLTATGGLASTSVSTLIQDVKLYQGTTLLDTESPSTTFVNGTAINFKNLNLAIPAGANLSFSVVADISPVGSPAPLANGVGIIVTIPGSPNSINAATPDIENLGGSVVTTTGASTGNAITFGSNGVSLASSPSSATAVQTPAASGVSGSGTFTFTFNVTAFGQNIYVGTTSSAFTATLYDNTTGAAATTTGTAISSGATKSANGNYLIGSGQTVPFTITVTKTGGANHLFSAVLNNFFYGVTDAATPAGTATATSTVPSTYTTPSITIQP
jgi:hypothetical protein